MSEVVHIPDELRESLRRDALKAEDRGIHTDRANATPNPGPTAKAFGPKWTPIGDTGVRVRAIVSADWDRLTTLSSPLIAFSVDRATGQQADAANFTMTSQDKWNACYLFTHPAADCRGLLEDGTEKFCWASEVEIGESWSDAMVNMVVLVITAKIKESWDTAVGYANQLEQKGEVHFFREVGATPTTGLGGK